MIVLGLDPGPERSGWALLERTPGRPDRFLDGGHCLIEHALVHVPRAAFVALEWQTDALYDRKRHGELVHLARVEGGVDWYLRQAGVRVVRLSANAWRGDVVRNSSPSDQEIERVLRLRVARVPDAPVISREAMPHVLDALGVAVAASYRPGEQMQQLMGGKRR